MTEKIEQAGSVPAPSTGAERLREALEAAHVTNRIAISFMGRDRGSPRQETTLDQLSDMFVKLDGTLSAALAAPQAPGTVTAPLEATEVMLDAGMDANPRGRTITDADLRTIYRAMIAARPKVEPVTEEAALDRLRGAIGEVLVMNGPVEDWPQDQLDNTTEAIMALITARLEAAEAKVAVATDRDGDPLVWRSKTPCFRPYISDRRYRLSSPAVRHWYEPICKTCAAASTPDEGAKEP